MDNGWVKLWRQIIKWEWYKTPNMVHLFLHLLLTANSKPGRWRGVEVKRGQLVTGRKTLTRETGISERGVRTCLTRLKTTSEITIQTTNKYSIITIVNYEHYQCRPADSDQQNDQQNDQRATSKRPANDHKQEGKEGEECKEGKSGGTKRFQKPTAQDVREYADSIGFVSLDAAYWIDYHDARGWKLKGGTPMKDWKATIRTWHKNEKAAAPPPSSPPLFRLPDGRTPRQVELEKYGIAHS